MFACGWNVKGQTATVTTAGGSVPSERLLSLRPVTISDPDVQAAANVNDGSVQHVPVAVCCGPMSTVVLMKVIFTSSGGARVRYQVWASGFEDHAATQTGGLQLLPELSAALAAAGSPPTDIAVSSLHIVVVAGRQLIVCGPDMRPDAPTRGQRSVFVLEAATATLHDGEVFRKVRAGTLFCVCLTDMGRAITFGAGDFGQLGVGDTEAAPSSLLCPHVARLPERTCLIEVACGGEHVIAVSSLGGLVVWGRNHHGQLGLGSPVEGSVAAPFVTVPRCCAAVDSVVVSVAAGDAHSFALSSDGSVWVCGKGHCFQRGDGIFDDARAFVRLRLDALPGRVLSIASNGGYGDAHSVFVCEGGVVVCGSNSQGQLGVGSRSLMVAAEPLGMNVPIDSVTVGEFCDHCDADNVRVEVCRATDRGTVPSQTVTMMSLLRDPSRWQAVCGWQHTVVWNPSVMANDATVVKPSRFLRWLAVMDERVRGSVAVSPRAGSSPPTAARPAASAAVPFWVNVGCGEAAAVRRRRNRFLLDDAVGAIVEFLGAGRWAGHFSLACRQVNDVVRTHDVYANMLRRAAAFLYDQCAVAEHSAAASGAGARTIDWRRRLAEVRAPGFRRHKNHVVTPGSFPWRHRRTEISNAGIGVYVYRASELRVLAAIVGGGSIPAHLSPLRR